MSIMDDMMNIDNKLVRWLVETKNAHFIENGEKRWE
jgi:hypothetical protein